VMNRGSRSLGRITGPTVGAPRLIRAGGDARAAQSRGHQARDRPDDASSPCDIGRRGARSACAGCRAASPFVTGASSRVVRLGFEGVERFGRRRRFVTDGEPGIWAGGVAGRTARRGRRSAADRRRVGAVAESVSSPRTVGGPADSRGAERPADDGALSSPAEQRGTADAAPVVVVASWRARLVSSAADRRAGRSGRRVSLQTFRHRRNV
jgi:hypothetical protein